MKLHPRKLLFVLKNRLKHRSITVLTGARQTGKTTLVRDLLPASGGPESVYFSLDDPDERLRLAADPVRRLDHGGKLVILDEIQKQPDLLDAVKLLADSNPGRRFVLLGSSQILLLKKVRETLAGRATLLDLWPLALIEKMGAGKVPSSGLDRILDEGEDALFRMSETGPASDKARVWRGMTEQHFLWGGYPALEPLPDEQRIIWLRDFRRTYLERDLSDLGRVADLDQFALAQNLFAARTAQLLSYSGVSRELGVAVNTVKRYVRFLEISYQVILLRPLLPTRTAGLVKTPKLFWTDPGLARFLSERMRSEDGSLFETAVLGELLRWLSWQVDPPDLHFYRTRAGVEVDFILHSKRCLLAMEVKASRRSHPQDARSLKRLFDSGHLPGPDHDARPIGLLINRAREVTKLAPHIWAVPDWRLFGPAF